MILAISESDLRLLDALFRLMYMMLPALIAGGFITMLIAGYIDRNFTRKGMWNTWNAPAKYARKR